MKSGELDNRVGDYAAAIVRDADLLLADVSNLNAEQREFADELQQHAVRFLSLFIEHLNDFTELTHDVVIVIHDLRNPLGLIVGYCELLLIHASSNLRQSQLQLLQQIKAAYTFIMNTFTEWVNKGMEKSKNAGTG